VASSLIVLKRHVSRDGEPDPSSQARTDKDKITALEDGKAGGEASAAKGIALDHLGDIAAKLRGLQLGMDQDVLIPSLDEVKIYVHPPGALANISTDCLDGGC
jgi:hypothetical protein